MEVNAIGWWTKHHNLNVFAEMMTQIHEGTIFFIPNYFVKSSYMERSVVMC